jgi:hypothetical protein
MKTNAVQRRASFVQHRVCIFTGASISKKPGGLCVPYCTSDTPVQLTTIHNNIWYRKECPGKDIDTLNEWEDWYLNGYSN